MSETQIQKKLIAWMDCPACKGAGSIADGECPQCEGSGKVRKPHPKRNFKRTLL